MLDATFTDLAVSTEQAAPLAEKVVVEKTVILGDAPTHKARLDAQHAIHAGPRNGPHHGPAHDPHHGPARGPLRQPLSRDDYIVREIDIENRKDKLRCDLSGHGLSEDCDMGCVSSCAGQSNANWQQCF